MNHRNNARSDRFAVALQATPRDSETLRTRWQDEGAERCARGLRVYALLTATMMLASAAYSDSVEPDLFARLLPIRLAGSAAMLGLLWAVSTRWGESRSRLLALFGVIVLALALHGLAIESHGQTSAQYDRMGFILLGAAVLFCWNAVWAASAGAAVLCIFLLGSLSVGSLGDEGALANFTRIAVTCLVAVVVSAVRERHRWSEMWQAHSLKQARQRADAEIRRLNEQLEQRVIERTAELHASEQRVRAMFEAAPIGVITVDAAGRIIEANAAFTAMLGEQAGHASGATIVGLTVPSDRAETEEAYAKLRAGTSSEIQMDKRYRRADGEIVTVREVVAAIRDDEENFAYAVAMIEDVGDKLRAEERARDHEERLAHLLRVGAMGEMATELAHELNQPLGAIVNFANGAAARLRKHGAEPEIVDSVARISTEGLRAGDILRRMRAFVRPGKRRRESIDLNDLVRGVLPLVRADARRHGVDVSSKLADALPPIAVDTIQFEQVVLNMLRNAIDAVRSAGAGDHAVTVETALSGFGVELRVQDTGPGIDTLDRERIFDAFFTTKPGSIGMGLSIARTIVEAHDGRVFATANSGRGLTVGFAIPVRHPIEAVLATSARVAVDGYDT